MDEDAEPDEMSMWKDFWGAVIPQTLGNRSGNLEQIALASPAGCRVKSLDIAGLQVVPAVFSIYGVMTMELGCCSGLFDIELPFQQATLG